jgi:hypothetical protein
MRFFCRTYGSDQESLYVVLHGPIGVALRHRDVDLHVRLRKIDQLVLDAIALLILEPDEQVGKVPKRGVPLMHRRRRQDGTVQQQLPDVLPTATDYLGHLRDTYEVGRHLDEHGFGNRLPHVEYCAENGVSSGLGLAIEGKSQTSSLADTHDRIIAPACPESLDMLVSVARRRGNVKDEGEPVFLHRSAFFLTMRRI